MRQLKRILIANRGEIACRVIRSARKMGIETVAVYSEADRKSLHVKMADQAYCIGPPQSSLSYLDMNKILAVALESKADSVHPGYGFLSENSRFMDLLDNNKIVFIGPKKHAIEAMGDKIQSKRLAKAAKVSIIPGFIGEVGERPEDILKITQEIGYPVMIKASAGGGGKGMRIAWNDQEAIEGYRLSKAEAKSSFGDDRMLIEKYIEQPRHIEFQILGDSHGNVIYLPERECSIQRRNQKVTEEAPSPFIDPETRKKMGEQAVALAKAVQYESSGTVEFMVDKNKGFYFLEMNTRLQVEHPITEKITGVDIVEEMIRVAQGGKLSLTQAEVKIKGHAIESRVYAEDPYRGFLPSIGHLLKYQEPKHENIRIDTGVQEGDEISMYYDPIISKTVTWGNSRHEALELMKYALDTYVVRGVGNNLPFCRDVLMQPAFVSGNYSTKFIQETYPDGFKPMAFNETEVHELLAVVTAMKLTENSLSLKPEEFYGGFVLELQDAFYFVGAEQGNKVHIQQIDADGNALGSPKVMTDVDVQWDANKALIPSVIQGKKLYTQFVSKTPRSYELIHKARGVKVNIYKPREFEYIRYMPKVDLTASAKQVLAPMPGAVISVSVKPGDKVNIGQELGMLEAMKMRNVLRSERAGVIKAVYTKEGASVLIDEVLFEFE